MYSRVLRRHHPIWPFLLWLLLAVQPALARDLPDFTQLAEEHSAAVVNIGTTLKSTQALPAPPNFTLPDVPQDSPLHDFFRKFFGEGQGGEMPRSSLGSGFIISADGHVISNYHVVKDAEEVVVRMSDRREFVAKVVGSDERSDIALLKIEADNLPAVKLGRSADLKVGEWVLAIGSPFGFDHSVTAGIVSAKGRSLPNENYIPFIQTDVAINPGNSGGPLFNLQGEVIGVNSQIYSRTGGFMGLSFAIPIDVVVNVYEQLKTKGSVSRGWLGVLIQDVTRELAESFGMSKPYGALVSKVLPDSPAAAAGIQPGDIVIAFNGQPIDLSSDLPPIVGSTPIGGSVPVDVIRNGDKLSLSVQIGELPTGDDLQIATIESTPGTAADNRLGLTVADLSDQQRGQLELDDHGVLVKRVDEGPAQRAGIAEGDVVLLIDNQKVADSAQFKSIVDKLPAGKSVAILIQRRGGPIFLALKVPE